MSSRPRLSEWESTWAFVAGGGLILIILAFMLSAMRPDAPPLTGMMVMGGLLLFGGTAGWLIQFRPWTKFDDLQTAFYTGHAAHDAHAPAADADHAAEPQADFASHGEPYMGDHGQAVPIMPPDMHDPISAFSPAAAADDLRLLDGVGPKIQAALTAAGIVTFADLAAHTPQEIEKIVRDAGVRMVGHPEKWIEDARKAAAGDRSVLQH